MTEIELTNCTMVHDLSTDRVLVLERRRAWPGIAFPGGHVEPGESILASAVREMREETGLTVRNLRNVGIIHWFNGSLDKRELIFCFMTNDYEGELISETEEGPVFWVDREELPSLKLASTFDQQLRLFFDDTVQEGFFGDGKPEGLEWF
jgi:8-oxo-dGTP diphosphatase